MFVGWIVFDGGASRGKFESSSSFFPAFKNCAIERENILLKSKLDSLCQLDCNLRQIINNFKVGFVSLLPVCIMQHQSDV